MIQADIDVEGIEELEKRLGKLRSKAPIALRNALNEAAATAKTEAKRGIADHYEIAQKNVKDTLRTKKATISKLSAQLTSRGSQIALSKFKVSPTHTVKRGKRGKLKGKNDPEVYKVSVEKSTGLKELSGSPKAFLAKMGSGHIGVMERISSRRLPLKQLYGPSAPSMMKNETVIERIQKGAAETMKERLDHHVAQILAKG